VSSATPLGSSVNDLDGIKTDEVLKSQDKDQEQQQLDPTAVSGTNHVQNSNMTPNSGSKDGDECVETSSVKQGSTGENSPPTDRNVEMKSDDTSNSTDSKPCANNPPSSVDGENIEMVGEPSKTVENDITMIELKKDDNPDVQTQIKTEPCDIETKTNGPATEPAATSNHPKFDVITIKEEPMDTQDAYNATQNGHVAKPNCLEGNDIKPNISVVVMLSGFSENFVKLAKKYCSALGLAVTSQPKSATHLV
jgi:hypothetical protein